MDNRDKPPAWRNIPFWCGKKAAGRGQLAVGINKKQMQGYQGRGQGARKGRKVGSEKMEQVKRRVRIVNF